MTDTIIIRDSPTIVRVTAPGPQGPAGVVAATVPITYDSGTQTVGLDYNATNLKLTSNALDTIQDLSTSSSPTFQTITGSGRRVNVATKTTDYTLAATDDVILANATLTLTLPTAVGAKWRYIIKNIGTGIVTIDGNGSETIDNAATLEIRTTGSGFELVSDGANARVIGVF